MNARLLLSVILFSLPLFGQTQASTSKPEDRCVLQGTVSNSVTGEPVKKVILRLSKRADTASTRTNQSYSARSEADGSFKIENIDPGTYFLDGNRAGYLTTRYGAKTEGELGKSISLQTGQQITNITFALIPQAVITGKVIDQDGDPVAFARVMILRQSWQRGKLQLLARNGGSANDIGEYRIPSVSAGRYYLLVEEGRSKRYMDVPVEPGKPDVRAIKTFYPSALRVADATPLEVKAGQDLSGMEIRLLTATAYHIRGKVVGSLPEAETENLTVNASNRDEQNFMAWLDGGTGVSKDRSFDIAGILPGSYTLNLFSVGGEMKAMGHQDVDVGQADLNDVQVAIVPPGSLHGQLTFDGRPQPGTAVANAKAVHFWLLNDNGPAKMFGNFEAKLKEDGTFTVDDLSPAKYSLSVDPPPGTYLKSVRYGSQELLGKEFDFTPGGGQLTMVLSYSCAEVDGTVQRADNNVAASDSSTGPQAPAMPDASIVLLPDALNEDGSGAQFGSANPDGSFSVKQVPPRHYRVYAFERIDRDQLQNPDFRKQLASKGVEVDLDENDKKQIQVPLITETELQQIYAQLGIETQ